MLHVVKRACAWCMALFLVLTILPLSALQTAAAAEITTVESTLDFTKMNKIGEGRNEKKDAENKAKVRDKLLAAGAVECENLYLAGNFETIANPGGYKEMGYYVQKATAAEGETIQNATLNFGYWICNSDPQGYIQVYVSADNVNYELVYEQREGNGPAFENSRRTEVVELPFKEGQTEIYVKFCMEHWNTYEGAGIAYSMITLNVSEEVVVSDKSPEQCTMVTKASHFNGLGAGEVTAEDIGAYHEENMFFGIDGVTLLSPRNGYEIASATWLLEAAEGEPLHDCVLTIVGRTWWTAASVKDDNYLKVYASPDGMNFTKMAEFRSNDNEDDTQRLVVDLTEAIKGFGKAYVKLEWLVFDSPHIFGIRSVTLTGNTQGIDTSGGAPTKMVVTNTHDFASLPVGEVDKETLFAYKSANLMFGYNKTPLLTAREAGEDAYVTWKLTAAEGETFDDCYLTLVGRFGYVDAELKDTSAMKVHISTDGGKNYSQAYLITPTEDQSDTQKIVVDLTAQAYGLSEILVRVYWTSKDEPSAMGLRAAALVANAGADYALYTPESKDRVIADEEMPAQESEEVEPTESVPPEEIPQQPGQSAGSMLWVVIAAVVAVIVIIVIVLVLLKKKKGTGQANG